MREGWERWQPLDGESMPEPDEGRPARSFVGHRRGKVYCALNLWGGSLCFGSEQLEWIKTSEAMTRSLGG